MILHRYRRTKGSVGIGLVGVGETKILLQRHANTLNRDGEFGILIVISYWMHCGDPSISQYLQGCCSNYYLALVHSYPLPIGAISTILSSRVNL